MKRVLLWGIGIASGFTTAAALVALIATIGVLNRLAQMTHSEKNIRWYEICFMVGGILGNALYIFEVDFFTLNKWMMGGIGLFMGIYLGCFIGALAEVLQIFPMLFHRMNLRMGITWILISMAVGKALGGIIGFLG